MRGGEALIWTLSKTRGGVANQTTKGGDKLQSEHKYTALLLWCPKNVHQLVDKLYFVS